MVFNAFHFRTIESILKTSNLLMNRFLTRFYLTLPVQNHNVFTHVTAKSAGRVVNTTRAMLTLQKALLKVRKGWFLAGFAWIMIGVVNTILTVDYLNLYKTFIFANRT